MTALRLGIETPSEAHIFMHKDCHVCRAEGFAARSRVVVSHGTKSVVATLYHVTSGLVGLNEAVSPECSPVTLKATEPAKPFVPVTVTV